MPPVIPLIHHDLHLSKTQVGILSGLPMVLFAGAAIAGSLLIARLRRGADADAGLLLCALGGALRGVGPHIAMLYAGTIVMAFGVAVMQPSLPPLVRAWVPQRVGFATAVYTNGLIIGEILPAALTIPLVLPMLHQSWQWTFAVLVGAGRHHRRDHPVTPRRARRRPRRPPPAGGGCRTSASPQIWRIGLLLGSVNATYFALNGFLPDYLTHTGRPDLINAALTALNLGQLPASFLLLASADRMVRTVWSYLVCGVVCLLPRAGDAARRHLGGDRRAPSGAASARRCWSWCWRCRR